MKAVMKKSSFAIAIALFFYALPLTSLAVAHASAGQNDASGLDCNGWSASSSVPNIKDNRVCADLLSHLANGWYVGHDEPSLQFFSSAAGSANNMQYTITLPGAEPSPKQDGSQTATFEN